MKISTGNEYIDVSGRKVLIVAEGKTRTGLKVFTGFQIDRDKTRIGQECYFKSDGRDFYGDIDSHLIREGDSGLSLSDYEAAILERLIEALDTDHALPVRVGPKMYGTAMPDFLLDPGTLNNLDFVDFHQTKGMHTRHRNAAIDAVTERRAKCSKLRIGRMEEALAWVPRFVWDEDIRKVLLAYAEVKARGWDWSRALQERNRRSPQKKQWTRRTVYRWIEKSLQQISAGLLKNAIILHDTAGLQVAHEEAKPSCKSITSGLHAWPAPEDIPAIGRTT